MNLIKTFIVMLAAFLAVTPEAMAAPSSGDISVMLSNVMNDLAGKDNAFITFFWMFCRFVGVVLVINGIAHLVKREGAVGGITSILVGALLIALPDTLGMINKTIFDSTAADSIMTDRAKPGLLNPTALIFVNFSVMMIQIVGFFALYRGIKTFADVALSGNRHQPDQTRAAWIFVISGVLCINIVFTLGMIAATLGGEAKTFYDKIF